MNTFINLPEFSKINPETLAAELTDRLAKNRQIINELLQQANFSWDNLIKPLEDMSVELSNYWSPVSHLNNVVNTDKLRKAYDA